MSLVTSGTPQTFLDQTSTLQEVAHYQASQVAAADAAQRTMSAAQVLHNAQVAQQQQDARRDHQRRSSAINSLLSQQQALLSRLRPRSGRMRAVRRDRQQRASRQRTSYALRRQLQRPGQRPGVRRGAVRLRPARQAVLLRRRRPELLRLLRPDDAGVGGSGRRACRTTPPPSRSMIPRGLAVGDGAR